MSTKKPRPEPEHKEELLDEALEESFPASDPASLVQPEGGISGAEDALQPGDALIVVDVQRDFCPGGSLPIENGDAVVPVLNRWIEQARRLGIPVFASRDWHPKGHMSFKPQGASGLSTASRARRAPTSTPTSVLPPDVNVVTKGNLGDRDQYSAFDATGLAEELRQRGVTRVFVGGLAEDVCVRATALDAVKSGLKTRLIAGATKPVTPAGGKAAIKTMQEAGVVID